MAYIKSHTVLLRHRKNIELAHDLRLNPVYSMGHLHALWHEALEQQEDGDLSRWSDTFIATSAAYPGDAPQFVRLLQKNGWLNETKVLHDWLDYAGEYLRGKYKTRNRDRLVEIWEKHGRVYGEKDEEKKGEGEAGTGKGQFLPDKTDRQTERPGRGRASGASKKDPGEVGDCTACQKKGVPVLPINSPDIPATDRFCKSCR